jgi:hypothetical protein
LLENPGFRVALRLPGMTFSPCFQEFGRSLTSFGRYLEIKKIFSSPFFQTGLRGFKDLLPEANILPLRCLFIGRQLREDPLIRATRA